MILFWSGAGNQVATCELEGLMLRMLTSEFLMMLTRSLASAATVLENHPGSLILKPGSQPALHHGSLRPIKPCQCDRYSDTLGHGGPQNLQIELESRPMRPSQWHQPATVASESQATRARARSR
eukprot:2902204-Rhodomonas_salina.1